MKHGFLLWIGLFFTFLTSWYGFVYYPQIQFGKQDLVVADSGQVYPLARSTASYRGQQVYNSLGCVYCHSQQVQPPDLGPDYKRGWGSRRSVAQDYLFDRPALPGKMRIGPDLSNVGVRETNVLWHLQHLYNPRSVAPGSVMPSFPFLFEKIKSSRRTAGMPPALKGPVVENGYELIPSPAALDLVDYLLSLRQETILFEAPLFFKPPSTNAPAGDGGTNAVTNAVPAATNASPRP